MTPEQIIADWFCFPVEHIKKHGSEVRELVDSIRAYGDRRAAEERERIYGKWQTLDSLPPGSLFETVDGVRAVKSEYYYPDGAPECVLLASGEYAHFADKGNTLVRALTLPQRPL